MLLAVYRGCPARIECRFMLIGIIMTILGVAAGAFMPLLKAWVIARNPATPSPGR